MPGKSEWFTGQLTTALVEERDRILQSLIRRDVGEEVATLICPRARDSGVSCTISTQLTWQHWSRAWEYPWVAVNGDFRRDHLVLDAGCGNSCLPDYLATKAACVVGLDLNPPPQPDTGNVFYRRGDTSWVFWPDGSFARVVCVSVLEHCPDPLLVVKELWRVLAPGGRLVMTFDVADYARHNHTVDSALAGQVCSILGVTPSNDVSQARLVELDEEPPLGPGDRRTVGLRVLGLWADKPVGVRGSG